MKQMIKILFLFVLLMLCVAGCSLHEIDLSVSMELIPMRLS